MPELSLRPANKVMRLSRLGSLHQSRLSFMRQLTRRMAREQWQFSVALFDIDDSGVGQAVYTAKGPQRSYSLVAFSHDLPAEMRSDRVIAQAWDATFTLFDGVPSADDIKRLKANVPKQEAGRVSERELSLSRANRSVRLWEYVVAELAAGRQPDIGEIDKVGYLMRTTAVYGSGKFGAADRDKIKNRDEMSAPFQAEMLSVYLTRTFVRDLVQHMARVKGGDGAVGLNDNVALRLGIGNSTGLGMAPFLINHPVLFHNWVNARETAIARVRALNTATAEERARFFSLFERNKAALANWHSQHPLQIDKLAALNRDVEQMASTLNDSFLSSSYPWERAMVWAEQNLSEEGQEWLASLLLEPYADLVEDLTNTMADDSPMKTLDGSMLVAQFKAILMEQYPWVMELDWNAPEARARVWYISEEKLEPRLGERYEEDVEDYEQPLGTGYAIFKANESLEKWRDDAYIADFLLEHPEHRRIVRRIQQCQNKAYSEIQDNTLGASLLPIDMLRAKLSFFGATAFDPRSDRWVRINMYKNAPYPEQLNTHTADDWVYPEVGS